jgi:protein AroM
MSNPIVGLVTIGQSPRVDVVPDMAAILGSGVTVRERGALDGLGRAEIAALAPRPGDDILVTRLADGTAAFVAKRHIVSRVQAAIGELERAGVTMTALLCTGAFPPLEARHLLVMPHQVLLGMLRALRWPGRLGIVTPSLAHVPQTESRWRDDGFDPVVVPLSPYEEQGQAALERVAQAFRAAHTGLVAMDCMGFRRETRDELRRLTGTAVLLANLLVARVVAEACGA